MSKKTYRLSVGYSVFQNASLSSKKEKDFAYPLKEVILNSTVDLRGLSFNLDGKNVIGNNSQCPPRIMDVGLPAICNTSSTNLHWNAILTMENRLTNKPLVV